MIELYIIVTRNLKNTEGYLMERKEKRRVLQFRDTWTSWRRGSSQRKRREYQEKPMSSLAVGLINWKSTASMCAIDAENRKLFFRRQYLSMDSSWAKIIAVVLCKKWKHCGAEVKGIGVGGVVHVIGSQGNRFKKHKTTLSFVFWIVYVLLCIYSPIRVDK